MLESLQEMMGGDGDAQVVANCMSVLQQAGAAQALVSRALVIPLLNRIKARAALPSACHQYPCCSLLLTLRQSSAFLPSCRTQLAASCMRVPAPGRRL